MEASCFPCECLLLVELFIGLLGPLAVHPVDAEDGHGQEEEKPRTPANRWNMYLVRKYSTAYLSSSRSLIGCFPVQYTRGVQGPELHKT